METILAHAQTSLYLTVADASSTKEKSQPCWDYFVIRASLPQHSKTKSASALSRF